MQKIEQGYKEGKEENLYYKALRDGGATFEDILYGIAIPQKKGFLCGDAATFSGSYDNADDYNFNLKLRVSFANCTFKNLEDRLPKVRGGNAYMYNCVVDSLQYYAYRNKLKTLSAASLVGAVNSSWKCGLVSQGIVCGDGASVKAENCIYRGIETLLKNNDTKNSAPYNKGGYTLVNCSYQKGENSEPFVGSSPDSKFTNATPTILSTENFEWHTEDKKQPFEISAIALKDIQAHQSSDVYGSGINTMFEGLFLKSDYTCK